MKHLNASHKKILWLNVIILSGGIAFMVYKKWQNPVYAIGAGLLIGTLEYFVMGLSLRRKQENDKDKHR